MNKKTIAAIVLVLLALTAKSSFYVLTEGRQAIITEFGKPIGEPVVKAGLHMKKPFFHDVRYVDKRILSWDGYPNQIPTKDKKFITVDTTARWKITDALKFIQTVRNEKGAKSRLDTILDSITRDIISGHNLVEAVRNSNSIVDRISAKEKEIAEKEKKGEVVVEEEVLGDIEPIQIGREQLSLKIAESADTELTQFGIKLVDVQLRRISYEESVEESVYDRMISERQRIAQKIRSIGQAERARIEGRRQKDLNKIESEAYREAREIRGKAEARATAIFTKSLSKEPKFFEFLRTMEAYSTVFGEQTQFIMSLDSDFLKYLRSDH
jgi:membrane protease subunit HflC